MKKIEFYPHSVLGTAMICISWLGILQGNWVFERVFHFGWLDKAIFASLFVYGIWSLFKKISVENGIVEFTRLVPKHRSLRIPIANIQKAGYHAGRDAFEITTPETTYQIKIGKAARERLLKALVEAGLPSPPSA